MTSKVVVWVAALVAVAGVIVPTVESLHIPGFVNGKPVRQFLDHIWMPESKADDCPLYEEKYFDNLVNHFDNSATTYKQVSCNPLLYVCHFEKY